MIKGSWYKKAFPTSKEVELFLKDHTESLRKIRSIKDIYAWGEYCDKKDDPYAIIKEIDLLIKCSHHSGDLVAISDGDDSPLHMSGDDLLIYGFNPAVVAFTKKLMKNAKYKIKYWVISKDNKVVHWGQMCSDKDEWEELKSDASNYARTITGVCAGDLKTSSLKQQEAWQTQYDHYINREMKDMPNGWYVTNYDSNEIKRVLL